MLSSLQAQSLRRIARQGVVARRGYHENIVQHYENPRNVGSLDKNDDSVGTVRNLLCDACEGFKFIDPMAC
jgi:hypothetical protein